MGTLGRVVYSLGKAARTTGQALDRLGSRLQGGYTFKDDVSKHQTVLSMFDKTPVIGESAFVAPGASVVGEVQIGEKSSIWYGCVLRGDVHQIKVGSETNIQDNTVVHVAKTNVSGNVEPTIIGNRVTIDTIAVAMNRAVEPERPLGRDSSGGFVEPVREGKEDVPLKDLIAPLDSMPPVDFAFAYGSGVFSQPLHTSARSNDVPMVDYILGVSSPVDWHAKNLEQNPHHYSSWLSWFGGKAVSNVAANLGAGVHFNAFVPWKNKKIKYGVISVGNLVRDVYTWQRLYIGGRLQKPVRFLVDRIHGEEMNRKNLQAALTAALLLLPPEFTEEDLYATICGLSYMGDVRMLFAEDKHKVRKIVQGSSSLFQDLYREPINKYATRDILHPPEAFSSDLKSRFKQDGRISTKYLLLSSLPACVLQRLARHTGTQYDSTVPANMAIAKAVVNSKEGHAKLVTKAVSSIVRTSSFRQMLSGLLAAGGVNAMQYVGRKISKAWQSR